MVRERVVAARARQQARSRRASRDGVNTGAPTNARLAIRDLARVAPLDEKGHALLERAVERFALSARAITRVRRVARTIADLAGSDRIAAADIAEALQISEGELLAAHLGAFTDAESPLKARRLRPEWPSMIAALEPLGTVMALTRNESCVHEKVGVYRQVSAFGPQRQTGLVLGGDIDLRLFYGQWQHGFAVTERLADGALQRSLQFFDAQGEAVHKVHLRPSSSLYAYQNLVSKLAVSDQSQTVAVKATDSTGRSTLRTLQIDPTTENLGPVAGLYMEPVEAGDTAELRAGGYDPDEYI